MPVQVSYTIEGEEPISHTFPGFSATQRVPIFGLYPDTDNEVKVTISDQAGNFAFSNPACGNRPATRLFSCHRNQVGNTSLRQEGWTLTEIGIGLGEAFERSFHHRCQRQRAMVYRAGCLYRSVLPHQAKNPMATCHFFMSTYKEYTMLGGVVTTSTFPDGTSTMRPAKCPMATCW